jgi:TRAP-type C4-dicarboxylate transport system substrate-binding protein
MSKTKEQMSRREFVKIMAAGAAGTAALPTTVFASDQKKLPQIVIRMAIPASKNSKFGVMGQWIKDKFSEITHGRAKVEEYWNGSLVPLKDHYRALESGILDFAFVNTGLEPGVFPLSELFQVPGIAASIAASNLTFIDLFNKYPEFEKQFSPKVKYIATSQFLLSDLHSIKPVRTLADLKGMKIGCQTPEAAEAMKLLGASASTIAWPDMYTQLERGVVDGVVAAWAIVQITHLQEIAKYHTLLRTCPGIAHWMFNRKTWNKFIPDEQEKFKLFSASLSNETAWSVDATSHDMRYKEITPEKGQTVIRLSQKDKEEIEKLFKPLWNRWVERMKKKGYPAEAILKDTLRWNEMYSYE